MAESVTIARPYAQAIFRLAREKQSLAEWSGRLHRLAAIAQDPEMGRVIGNPKFSTRQLADLFISLSGEPEGSRDSELASFIALLAENRRFNVLADISAIFESLKNEDQGIKEALITSAFPINKKALTALLGSLETLFGGRLQGRVDVDPSLIGGVRVAVGDRVFDASVRGKLDAMAATLKN
ncbi:ATP synthase subunit delta [Betaproteobacteria bacterium]|nr:ATP synthase subunit delta [Betaproteobacteria bacterium]